MSATEWLSRIAQIDTKKLSKEENLIIEAELYLQICQEIVNQHTTQNKFYFRICQTNNKENNVIDLNFVRCLIEDIIKSEAYTISGIAYYTDLPEEIIYDFLIKDNAKGILSFPRKIIELHRTIRPEIYEKIIKKFSLESLHEHIDINIRK